MHDRGQKKQITHTHPMATPWLLVSTALLGAGVLLAYADVFTPGAGYLASPHWLELPRAARLATVALQLVAVPCYVAWLLTAGYARPATADPWLWHLSPALFLLPSAAWPYASRALLRDRASLGRAVAASACLWAAAAGVPVQLALTWQAGDAAGAALLAPLVLLTAGLDGAGWSAAAILGAVRGSTSADP